MNERTEPPTASAGAAGSRVPPAPAGERLLLLRGQWERRPVRFPLAEGENVVGSAATSAIVLAVRGVSRHHARIHVADGAATVVDLGSKNGIQVNGRTVGSSPLAPGDEVRFGPVALRLEQIAPADAELGVEISAGAVEATASRPDPGATSHLGEGGVPALAWVRLINDVLERLTLPPGDPQGALGLVVRHLELSGAALVVWPVAGEAVLQVVAGRLGELPWPGDRPADGVPGVRSVTAADLPCTVWSDGGVDGTTFGLVLWGDFPGRSECAPLAAALGRLFHRSRPEPLAALAGGRLADSGGLAFPEGYVAGDSAAMRALHRQMEMLAGADLPVLVCGETGAGKEPVARTLHASSPRRDGPFVAVNCAAIPAELLEAEMFGIGRNVATGVAGRQGRFVEASGGTIFLDEIGDMPPPLQAKLLRALQEREVQPVGAAPVAVDVRVVAATNTDLRSRAAAGHFRRDLYYRIAGFVLEVPPLRKRLEDLPALAGHFLRRACEESGKSVRGLTVKALRHLEAYPWPGNVRELDHEMRRLVVLCPQRGVIDSLMLPDHVLAPEPSDDGATAPSSLDLAAHTEALERRLLRVALARTRGNQSQAAQLLGLSRNGLANRLKRYGIAAAGPASPAGSQG